MNVSEFTSVNDATDSLVSMSQAFSDLSKIDIIDKLNNIGNNFSISTSELAESLQKSSGTLKVAGNTIDEAIALTTAGNSILQDPSTVGTGLKMISLRLTGTKQAAEELVELGEDTDSMITTQSKLRSTIMEATKVASNGFAGFDILDNKGNYKSTYEIMLGIAEIYKEIQEQDKELGQQNANLLLETVAGKNRSSVAAAIFQNPELLRDVYKSVQSSSGSAQVENSKYLDSITGKIQIMKNHIQEIENMILNSQGLKTILDLVNLILSGITSILDKTGALGTVLGSITSMVLMKKDMGVFDFISQLK